MIEVKFKGYPEARIILGDEPVGSKIGIIECKVCGQRTWLDDGDTNDITRQIEFFIKQSECSLDTLRGAEAFKARFLLRHPEAQITIKKKLGGLNETTEHLSISFRDGCYTKP